MRFSDNMIVDLLVTAIQIQISQDQQSKIWAFIDPSTEYGLPKTINFGDETFKISIIDPFNQHRPQLMNYRSADDRWVGIIPSIILDSNAAFYLHQYVCEPEKLSPGQTKAVRELIRYLATKNYDYNPFFYYLETFSKDNSDLANSKIVRMTESIIKLQSMDQPLFLQTGEIKPDKGLFKKYIKKFQTDVYSEMAVRQVAWLQAKNPFAFAEFKNLYSVVYISLLKMALLRRQSQKGIKHKHIQLRNYMVETLGVVLGRELYIALLYFAGLIDTFIPFQKGSDFEQVRPRIRAAAWDALMMRLTEFYLPAGSPEPVTLAYICTADKALQKIAKGIHIQAVLSLMPRPHFPRSLLTFDYKELVNKVGKETTESLLIENDDWQAERWASTQSRRVTAREDGLLQIIQGLEEEMRSFCK